MRLLRGRREWDSNPRGLFTLPLFESGTFDHSDISPRRSITYLFFFGKPCFSTRAGPGEHLLVFSFVDSSLLIEPARKLHVFIIFHALSHFGILVKMLVELD